MKTLAVPTLLAAAVAAAVAFAVARSGYGVPAPPEPASGANLTAPSAPALTALLAAYKKNPPATTLTLSKESGACRAEVDSDPVGNLPERRVFWYVLNDADFPCDLTEANPKIKLVFTPNATTLQYPFQKKEVESKRQNDLVYVHEKIKKWGKGDPDKVVDYGKYSYKVYLLNGKTQKPDEPVLDPDLEVEDDGNRNAAPQAPPAPAPAAPPAKKQ